MAYNQTTQTTPENNNALYFIVGGLLVLALIIGAFVLNTNDAENAYEPAAGISAPATNDTTNTNDAAPSVGTTTGSEEVPAETAPLAP